MSRTHSMIRAKMNKQDEFYTKYETVLLELKHHQECFKDKVVYCNCDDNTSAFFKYFTMHFHKLGLKEVIATGVHSNHCYCYDGAFRIEMLPENGDFRSYECVELLKESDIVVTNPPFSLFREYMQLLFDQKKDFLILGNMNAVMYLNLFPKIKNDEVRLGYTLRRSSAAFGTPSGEDVSMGNVRWFTNLPVKVDSMVLTTKYDQEKYFLFHNYNAIFVPRVDQIPVDYDGVMGVPVSFLDQYDSKQFEIVGSTKNKELMPESVVFGEEFCRNYRMIGGSSNISPKMYGMGYYDEYKRATLPYTRILIRKRRI